MQRFEKVPVPLYGQGSCVMSIPESARVLGCEREVHGPGGTSDVCLLLVSPDTMGQFRSIDVRFQDLMAPVSNNWKFLGELVDPTGLPFTVWWREQDV
jgi:hypothetical protein